ncbi:MAG: serine hydrolase [Oscillospiraceae bacterium]
MKAKRLIAAAAALSAAMMTSCGAVGSDASQFTRKENAQVYAMVESEEESLFSEAEQPPADESEEQTEQPADDSQAQQPDSEPEPEPEPKPDPVKLDKSVLEGHNFTINGIKGKVYSNEELENALNKIDGICNDYSDIMSFAYLNLDTGASCEYRSSVQYPTCSTIKAPFVKQLLESGVDLDEKIPINVKWTDDTGKFASKPFGTEYTVRQFMKYAVSQSDNTAYYNLVNYFGWYGFNEKNNELGVNYYLGDGWIFTYCTVNDLLIQYEDIYRYAEKSKRGQYLISLMQETDLDTQISAQLGDKYTVAHKYGADAIDNCFHDCAIVYADSPFVLIIMTNQTEFDESSTKVFKKLAKQFDAVNSQLYVKPSEE